MHRVEDIGQAAWDRLAAGRPFASYRWYGFGEAVLADNKPVYVILSRGEPVARATFWLTRQEPLPISPAPLRWMIDALIRRWPLLICRAPVAGVPGLILPDGAARAPTLMTIAQVAQRLAQQYRASFLIFDGLDRQQAEGGGWPAGFRSATAGEAGTCLKITWPDFESYLNHLSRKARKDYRRNCSRARDLGIQVRRHPMTQPLDRAVLDRAVKLIRNVEKHHHSAPNPWARAILENAGRVDATWFIAEAQGRFVGCALFFEDAQAGFATLLGLDYQIQYVYFQILYAILQYAIERKLQVYHGGSGAFDIKQLLGFQVKDNNYVTFATGSPALQRITGKVF